MRQIASKNMAKKMAEMKENSAEVIQVTTRNMDYMKEKAEDTAREIRRKPLHESGIRKGKDGYT